MVGQDRAGLGSAPLTQTGYFVVKIMLMQF